MNTPEICTEIPQSINGKVVVIGDTAPERIRALLSNASDVLFINQWDVEAHAKSADSVQNANQIIMLSRRVHAWLILASCFAGYLPDWLQAAIIKEKEKWEKWQPRQLPLNEEDWVYPPDGFLAESKRVGTLAFYLSRSGDKPLTKLNVVLDFLDNPDNCPSLAKWRRKFEDGRTKLAASILLGLRDFGGTNLLSLPLSFKANRGVSLINATVVNLVICFPGGETFVLNMSESVSSVRESGADPKNEMTRLAVVWSGMPGAVFLGYHFSPRVLAIAPNGSVAYAAISPISNTERIAFQTYIPIQTSTPTMLKGQVEPNTDDVSVSVGQLATALLTSVPPSASSSIPSSLSSEKEE